LNALGSFAIAADRGVRRPRPPLHFSDAIYAAEIAVGIYRAHFDFRWDLPLRLRWLQVLHADYALRRRWIKPHHHKAATLLSISFQKAGLLPRVTMSWATFIDGGSGGDVSEMRGRHAKKFREAIQAIPDDYRDGFFSWF
jgi:hypothetical protein